MSDNINPTPGAPIEPERPGNYAAAELGKGPGKLALAATWLKLHAGKIMIALVIAMVVVIAGRGCNTTKTPVQNLGLKKQNVSNIDPTMANDQVSDMIKDRDAKKAEMLQGNENAIKHGQSYLPELTKEYADPLSQFAKTAPAFEDDAPKPMDVQLPPPPPPSIAGNAKAPAVPQGTQPEPMQYQIPTSGDSGTVAKPGGLTRAERMQNEWVKLKGEALQQTALAGGMGVISIEQAGGAGGGMGAPGGSQGGGAQSQFASQPVSPGAGGAMMQTVGTSQQEPLQVLQHLGGQIYATNDFLANSDRSKFIQATVLGGPYKGAIFQGSFERRSDRLEMVYRHVNWRGNSYDIDVIAVNPDQPEVGMATDVNNHYLIRYGGFFVSRMLAGVGGELSRSGSLTSANLQSGQVVTSTPTRTYPELAIIGLGDTMGALSEVAAKNLDMPPTVVVAAETPIGLLFRADWLDKPSQTH